MPKTLLLADDSVTIQKVVGISFANEDVELLTVSNGDEAIARAREVHPDIVLADVVMPGANGYEVCEAIKADPALAGTPVLLLTGTFEAFDEDRANQAGADGHVTKPFEAQALVDRVNALFAQRGAPAATPIGSIELKSEAVGSVFDLGEEEVTAPGAPSIGNDATVVAARREVEAAESPENAMSFDVPRAAPSGADALDEAVAGTRAAQQWNDPYPAPDATMTGGEPLVAAPPDPDPDPGLGLESENPYLRTNPRDLGSSGAPGPEPADPFRTDDAASAPAPAELDPLADSGSDARDAFGFDEPAAAPAPDPLAGLATDDDGATRLFEDLTPPPDGSETRIMDFGDGDTSPPAADPARGTVSFDAFDAPGQSLSAPEASQEAVLDPDRGGAYDVSSSDLGDPLAPSAAAPAPTPAPWQAAPEAPAPFEAFAPDPEPVSADPGALPADPEPFSADSEPFSADAESFSTDEPQQSPALAGDAGAGAFEAAPAPSWQDAPEAPADPVLPGSPTPELASLAREQVHAAIEKIAWEAFSQVAETIVKDALERVEKVAWEVVPQMTEALIREEIRKLKEEE